MLPHRITLFDSLGTSNWAGDYFESRGTGAAIVVRQNASTERPFVRKMRDNFFGDWFSAYTHSLNEYYDACITSVKPAHFCEVEKDTSFQPTTQPSASIST